MSESQNPLSSQPSPDKGPPPIPSAILKSSYALVKSEYTTHALTQNRQNINNTYICTTCGSVGKFKTKHTQELKTGCLVMVLIAAAVVILPIALYVFLFTGLIGLLLILSPPVFLLILVCYFVFRGKESAPRECLICSSTESVPLASPKGQQLLNSFSK